jgi:hypothetical protein
VVLRLPQPQLRQLDTGLLQHADGQPSRSSPRSATMR